MSEPYRLYAKKKPEGDGALRVYSDPDEAANLVGPDEPIYAVKFVEIPAAGTGELYWDVTFNKNCCSPDEWEVDCEWLGPGLEEEVNQDTFEDGYHFCEFWSASNMKVGTGETKEDAIGRAMNLWAEKANSDDEGAWRFRDAPTRESHNIDAILATLENEDDVG